MATWLFTPHIPNSATGRVNVPRPPFVATVCWKRDLLVIQQFAVWLSRIWTFTVLYRTVAGRVKAPYNRVAEILRIHTRVNLLFSGMDGN